MIAPELFIKIYEACPLPALLLLPDAPHFTIAAVNTAYVALTCTKEADMAGKSVFKTFAGYADGSTCGNREKLRQSLLTVVRTGLPDAFDTQMNNNPVCDTGTPYAGFYHVENIPVTGKEGNVVTILHTISDGKKKEEQHSSPLSAVDEDNHRYQYLMKATGEAVWDCNLITKSVYRSEGFETLFGYTADDYKDSYSFWRDHIHPDDKHNVLGSIAAALSDAGNSYWKQEYRFMKADGNHVHISDRGILIRNETGQVYRMVGAMQDVTKQKSDAFALQQSEARQKGIIASQTNYILRTDLLGSITYYNEKFSNDFGWLYNNPGLMGISCMVSVMEYHHERIIHTVGKCFASPNEVFQVEIDKPALNGGIKTTLWDFICLTDADGHPAEMQCVGIDISDRIKAEHALTESNERFEYVTKATFDAIWDWNLLAGTIYWSEGFHTIFGYNFLDGKADITSWTDHIHPGDKNRVLEKIYRVIDGTRTNWMDEYRFCKSDQTYAYVTDKGFVIRDKMGKAIRMVGAMQDITKQKKEEHQLRLLESVVTNTKDGVVITEADPLDDYAPIILYVNEAFSKMTGYTAEEVIGKSPVLLHGPKTDPEELKKLGISVRSGDSCDITMINYKKSGEEFWISFSFSPVIDENGWFSHWISIMRDVTQQKNEEMQNWLLADVSQLFNEPATLNKTLELVLEQLVNFGDFSMAEAWLIGTKQKRINLVATFPQFEGAANAGDIVSFAKGEGLPGTAWLTKTIQFWRNIHDRKNFIRKNAAKWAEMQTAYGIPIIYNQKVIGVFVLGLHKDEETAVDFTPLFERLGVYIGAEIMRKQLEQELNQLFSFAPDIICSAGLDGYFKKINAAACILLQYTEAELLAVPFATFIHPDDREKTSEVLAKSGKEMTIHYLENRYITKSGKTKWLGWTTTQSPEEGLVLAVAKDITEKKELEDLLNKATSLARIGGWEMNLLSGVLYWSVITREIFDMSAGFPLSVKTVISFLKKGSNRAMIVHKMQEAVTDGAAFDVEVQIITAGGKEKWIRTIGETEFVHGKCVRVYGSIQDIDLRKRAELAAIRVLEEKNTILESIGDAFFAVDKKWMVTYWNKEAEKLTGITKSETVGHSLWNVYPDERNALFYTYYQKAVTENMVQTFEVHDETRTSWHEVVAYPSDSGLSVYLKDITERKRSEISLIRLNESLQKQSKELAISNAELEQFAFVASHDLQEPLRMVTSFLTKLDKKYAAVIDDTGKKYIHFAVDGAKRMRQIILDLLEFSRAGKTEDKQEDVNCNELISEIKILLRKKMGEKNASIRAGKLPVLHAFKAPLRQVFQNLAGNALQYTREHIPAIIEITAAELNNYWQFSVSDNGIGISSEYFDKIFIIFQRLHSKEEFSGTGMGLAVSKKIIENMGGKIWVESTEGTGSTFYFTIAKHII